MKTSIVLILSMIAGGLPAPEREGVAQETQVHGYWGDPGTGLMWAGRDNGKDVSWHDAIKYCRNLRLAGYADWRLANMFELQPIYDKTANAPGLAGKHTSRPRGM